MTFNSCRSESKGWGSVPPVCWHPSVPTMLFLLWERMYFLSIGERYFKAGSFILAVCMLWWVHVWRVLKLVQVLSDSYHHYCDHKDSKYSY